MATKTKNGSRFERGSGCYKCGCCGRMTRATGRHDNEYNGLCAECYDLGGLENQVADGDHSAETAAEIAELRKRIRALGGVLVEG